MKSPELRALAIAELVELATGIDGPVMVWSNEVLVTRGAAPEAVEFYRSRGDVILGFEGFDTDGKHRMPRMDYIADFSSLDESRPDAVDLFADAALRVLSGWESGPQFIAIAVQRRGEG